MDTPLRHLFLVLAAFLAVMLPGAVYANALPVPISVSPGAAVPTGLQSVVTFDARGLPGAANAGYYSRPVLVSNSTLSGLAKGLLRRTAPVAAMSAAIAGAGWAIDELTKQVTSGGQGQPTIPAGDRYWVAVGLAGYYPSAQGLPYKACMASFGQGAATHCPTAYLAELIQSNAGWDEYYIRVTSAPHATFIARYAHPYTQPLPNADYVPASPVSDAQLGQLVANNPALAAEALRNPDGSVNRNPDVVAAAQALANELANTTGPQPDPTGQWDTGQQGGNPVPAGATELEFPGFCAWATVVCDAIDWVKLPADPLQDVGMPIENLPVTQSNWVSGLGNGACPSPRSIGLSSGSFEMSFQPACDLAGYVRPLVIISALLLGAFIVVGAGRQA